jgi:hypothetical protein
MYPVVVDAMPLGAPETVHRISPVQRCQMQEGQIRATAKDCGMQWKHLETQYRWVNEWIKGIPCFPLSSSQPSCSTKNGTMGSTWHLTVLAHQDSAWIYDGPIFLRRSSASCWSRKVIGPWPQYLGVGSWIGAPQICQFEAEKRLGLGSGAKMGNHGWPTKMVPHDIF